VPPRRPCPQCVRAPVPGAICVGPAGPRAQDRFWGNLWLRTPGPVKARRPWTLSKARRGQGAANTTQSRLTTPGPRLGHAWALPAQDAWATPGPGALPAQDAWATSGPGALPAQDAWATSGPGPPGGTGLGPEGLHVIEYLYCTL
jgi:hypothetical protein